jgi:spermidine/putrescine-binding protein
MGAVALGTSVSPLLAACGSNGAGSATSGTLNLADLGVGDPGDWSLFKNDSGWDVNLVAIGNAPAQVVNVLQGGGTGKYHVLDCVGGMQKPLVQNDLIKPLDTAQLPNWGKNEYIEKYFPAGQAGFDFIGYEDEVYGYPTVLQGDSFAYLPDETGPLDSYGALFDPQFRGYVALEDNFTTAGQKAALYLKSSGQAEIEDPANMTPDEIKTVVDFLIEQKKSGQFRALWSSFDQAVSLLTDKEVKVLDCWEPIAITAQQNGVKAVYAEPAEGWLLWAYVAYLVNNPDNEGNTEKAAYDLMDFMGSGWYGATITLKQGYMTNPQAVGYAEDHPDEFSADDAKRIRDITERVQKKFEQGGTWQNRWPDNVETYQSEWARFTAA